MLTIMSRHDSEGFEVRTHICLIEKRAPVPLRAPSMRVMWSVWGFLAIMGALSGTVAWGFVRALITIWRWL